MSRISVAHCCYFFSPIAKERELCHAGDPGYGEPRLDKLAILERLTRFRLRA